MNTFTTILKWTGILLAGLVVVGLGFYAVVYFQTEAAIHKNYTVDAQMLHIPGDSATYQLGQHLSQIRGCQGCHGADLSGGRAFADEHSPIGILYVSNITSGKGGLRYTDLDWIRALRHGIGKDSKPLWFMPSHETALFSNRDLAALIGYLKKQPPVDKNHPPEIP